MLPMEEEIHLFRVLQVEAALNAKVRFQGASNLQEHIQN
jgi:hypothetical protein